MDKLISINNYIRNHWVLCDGAFGTYYASLYETDDLPEKANILHPDRVKRIHQEYLKAGARLIRTNTFACNSLCFDTQEQIQESINYAYRIAKDAVSPYCEHGDVRYIAADIGPIRYEKLAQQELIQKEYIQAVQQFLGLGAEVFVFETFASFQDIQPAIERIGDQAYVIVQFAVNQYGYSSAGLSAHKLFEEAHRCHAVDAVGLNCGVGPGHMHQLIGRAATFTDKYLSALPNAGYPQIVSNRMIFSNKNMEYFVEKTLEMAEDGVRILGGCCGTTPDYIQRIASGLNRMTPVQEFQPVSVQESEHVQNNTAFYQKGDGRKLIAVELAPPLGSNDEVLMDAAHLLKSCDVDVVTFPDSPSGRTRADSILMAEKVSRETGLTVMPHICCRDKNAIAMRSQLLGAHINKINNFLVITGDPIPSVMRGSVESVFNFDSVGLMNVINDMNQEIFKDTVMTYGGAINQGRRNLQVEIARVKKKIEAGATFFMTQPVFSEEDILRLRQIKEETGARILYGIMPFVSRRNALFMKNEMSGINVTDEVLARFTEDMTREEGEAAGISLAVDMIQKTFSDADGYYFSFPFNRVHMLKSIMNTIDEYRND